MLTIYTVNDGTKYMIRLAGPKFTWTSKLYSIAVEAQRKTFSSREQAQAWIDERL